MTVTLSTVLAALTAIVCLVVAWRYLPVALPELARHVQAVRQPQVKNRRQHVRDIVRIGLNCSLIMVGLGTALAINTTPITVAGIRDVATIGAVAAPSAAQTATPPPSPLLQTTSTPAAATPAATASADATLPSYREELSVPCVDCQEPHITLLLLRCEVDAANTKLYVYLQFRNDTPEGAYLKYDTMSLRDAQGTLHPGVADPVLIQAHQSAPSVITFDLAARAGASYTLTIIVERPNKYVDGYERTFKL